MKARRGGTIRTILWAVTGGLGLMSLGVGCSTSHERTLQSTSTPAEPPASGQPVTHPSGEGKGEVTQWLDDYWVDRAETLVDEAKGALKSGELQGAATLAEQALQLDPDSKAALILKRRIQQQQREREARARREQAQAYQQEGLRNLAGKDFERAVAYFQAALELEPANRRHFKLIQRTYEVWHQLQAAQRARDVQHRPRLAKTAALPEDQPAFLNDLLSSGALVPPTVQPLQQADGPIPPVSQVVGSSPEPPAAASFTTPMTGSASAAEPPPDFLPSFTGEPNTPWSGALAGGAEFTVQPGDVLQVTVYEEPELTTKARVASTGEIIVPLLGRVAVVGLTATQVQEKLTRLLAEDYLVNPQLQVFVESYQLRNVFVTGAVNKPGSYAIPTEKPTTLLEALAMAGGVSERAAANSTRIIRMEDGQERAITVKVTDIIKKGDKAKDVVVRPNDVIFIPESFF